MMNVLMILVVCEWILLRIGGDIRALKKKEMTFFALQDFTTQFFYFMMYSRVFYLHAGASNRFFTMLSKSGNNLQ